MSPLNKKVLRDLWRLKGQVTSIAIVIAVGVMLLITMSAVVTSLENTKRAYYEQYRFADMFAGLTRAPLGLQQRLKHIPGVASLDTRIHGRGLIDMPGKAVPIHAEMLSLPDFSEPRLNAIYLQAGSALDPAHPDQAIVLKSFADVHQLQLGDTLKVTINGFRRELTLVGIAMSPEFIYATAPGELAPDDGRFAAIWMGEKALAAAYDLDGAFNQVLLDLAPNAIVQEVITAVDKLTANYGGSGAYGVKDHFSNRSMVEEINGLKASAKGVPPIFLAVAAFLLNIVVSRMIKAEREQIGLLKAFGYTSMEIGLHYFMFILSVAIVGTLLGCLLGAMAGGALSEFYMLYFKFPYLLFSIDKVAFLSAFFVSVSAASLGGIFVLRQVFELTAAEAMRPPTPPDYSRGSQLGHWFKKLLDQPSKMVLRGIIRQPARLISSTIGVSVGMGLSVAMISLMNGFDQTLEVNFSLVDRSDVTVSFVQPQARQSLFELQRIPGVLTAEAFRQTAVTLTHGLYTHRGGIIGMLNQAELSRAVDKNHNAVYIRQQGITLSSPIAKLLNAKIGDKISVKVHQGHRPSFELKVTQITQSLLGSPIYMELESLGRHLKQSGQISGAYLSIDSNYSEQIYRKLKDMPKVAGVSISEDARAAFKKLMDTGAGAIRYVMAAIAAIITFGIVYNSARIAFAERARDLASLRVMGLTRSEAGFILLGELGLIVFIALPLGSLLGIYMTSAVATGFSSDLYTIPAIITPESHGIAAIAVLIASILSGALVQKDIAQLDLVSALKIRE